MDPRFERDAMYGREREMRDLRDSRYPPVRDERLEREREYERFLLLHPSLLFLH
jgi:hypothetical protein